MDDVKHISHSLCRMVDIALKVNQSRFLLQNTVLVGSGDGVFINAGDIKAAAERTVPAFAADVLALVVFLVLVLGVLGSNGQNTILDIQLNVFLVKARQLSF